MPTILGMVIKEVHPIFGPISSLAARGYWKFVGKCPDRGKMVIPGNLIVCSPKATKLKILNLPTDAYTCWEFSKNCANESPLRGKFVGKVEGKFVGKVWNFEDFGGCIPTFLLRWTWNLVGAMCRPCGAKNQFLNHWVNAIPAWLRCAQACR